MCLGEEEPLEAKLRRLLMEESKYLFSREREEPLLLFQDNLLPVDGENSSSEPESPAAASFLLDLEFIGLSSSFVEPSPTLESQRATSWSELESNSPEISLMAWFSNMARTSAVAFSALFLWLDTISSCSSSSST